MLLSTVSVHLKIHHSSQNPSSITSQALSLPLPLPPPPPHKKHLFRLPPRQRLNTIHHILKRPLILFSRPLRALHLPSIIPLDLKRRQHNPRIEPVDILLRVRGETFELLDEGEELVDVVAGWISALGSWERGRKGEDGTEKGGRRGMRTLEPLPAWSRWFGSAPQRGW